MSTSTYSGSVAISGSGSESNGVPVSVAGTLGVSVSATLDGTGSGTASETVSGNLNFQYTMPGGESYGGTVPVDFSDSNLAFQAGSFTGGGDGKADILWRNDNGQAAVWTMNGATRLAGSAVGGNPGTTGHIPAGIG